MTKIPIPFILLLLLAFVIAQKATYPPKSCTTAFYSGSTIIGCQHCDSHLAFYYWDGYNYVRRDDPNVILDPNAPSVGFTQQSITDIERLGYGQCTSIDWNTNSYTLPALNCASYGLSSDCYYSFGLLKAAAFTWDYGYGQASCPWWNITSGGTLRTSELCDGVESKYAISHLFYCVDVPKPCHIETCMCAEWQLKSFALTSCGATVTWRVWNYCANSPYWIKFNIAGLGTVSGVSYSSPSGVNYQFSNSVTASDSDFGGSPTLGFYQQGTFNTNYGFAGSPTKNYIDVTFTVSSWPGADYDWYMGMHAGPYWDYYNTKDYFRDGDWSTMCQSSRSATCASGDTCKAYCCTEIIPGALYSASTNSGSSCPVGTVAVGSQVTADGCKVDCSCGLVNCPTTAAPTTLQSVATTTQEATTTLQGESTTTLRVVSTITTQDATTTTQQGDTVTQQVATTTTQQGDTPLQRLTTTQSASTTPADTTTKPVLPCEQTGTCVTLAPQTQSPAIPTKTPCPGDCNGHGTCDAGVCTCYSGLAGPTAGSTISYSGADCSVTVINLPKAICSAFTNCDLCNAGKDGDGNQCQWNNCDGALLCTIASASSTGCSAVTSCAGTVVFQAGQCPDNCSDAGTCAANGTCICKKGVSGINCGSRTGLSAAAKAAAISAGVIAAIALCGVVAILIVSFGAKKAVDWVGMDDQANAKSHVSPLYHGQGSEGMSGIYKA